MQRPKHKYSVQAHTMDFTRKVVEVANSLDCEKHNALAGFPCWGMMSDNGQYLNAICNSRAKRMFNGRISVFSSRTSRSSSPKKELS